LSSILRLLWPGLVVFMAVLVFGCCEEPPCLDTVPPMAVTDLRAASVTDSSVTLVWTAPGDDGDQGTAAQYDIRYSTEAYLGTGWWDAVAVAVATPPVPKVQWANARHTLLLCSEDGR
jgi:hypothetical protein